MYRKKLRDISQMNRSLLSEKIAETKRLYENLISDEEKLSRIIKESEQIINQPIEPTKQNKTVDQQIFDRILPPSKTWLRAGDVAVYLDISKSSVFRLVKTGEISYRRFGHSIRFLRSDILAFEHSTGVDDNG